MTLRGADGPSQRVSPVAVVAARTVAQSAVEMPAAPVPARLAHDWVRTAARSAKSEPGVSVRITVQ